MVPSGTATPLGGKTLLIFPNAEVIAVLLVFGLIKIKARTELHQINGLSGLYCFLRIDVYLTVSELRKLEVPLTDTSLSF